VCRRVLGHYHDAEDAFQATFLVLVRKADSIAAPALLANWLYGVAHQTALKARATAAKRRTRERQVTEMPERAATEQVFQNDLLPLLDQELSRLSDIYRAVIVLCDLEGKTRTEAARQLGVPEGTLAARLARGRAKLARRLARHGVAVPAGALAALLPSAASASASAPPAVVSSTIQVATAFAARLPLESRPRSLL
jgi:RNA polymerase sigma factor (sigma-70 family)